MEVIRVYYYQGYFFFFCFVSFLSENTVGRLLDGIFCFSGLVCFQGLDKIKLLMDKIRTKNVSVFVHDFQNQEALFHGLFSFFLKEKGQRTKDISN